MLLERDHRGLELERLDDSNEGSWLYRVEGKLASNLGQRLLKVEGRS